jgi:hypothetical protein
MRTAITRLLVILSSILAMGAQGKNGGPAEELAGLYEAFGIQQVVQPES